MVRQTFTERLLPSTFSRWQIRVGGLGSCALDRSGSGFLRTLKSELVSTVLTCVACAASGLSRPLLLAQLVRIKTILTVSRACAKKNLARWCAGVGIDRVTSRSNSQKRFFIAVASLHCKSFFGRVLFKNPRAQRQRALVRLRKFRSVQSHPEMRVISLDRLGAEPCAKISRPRVLFKNPRALHPT